MNTLCRLSALPIVLYFEIRSRWAGRVLSSKDVATRANAARWSCVRYWLGFVAATRALHESVPNAVVATYRALSPHPVFEEPSEILVRFSRALAEAALWEADEETFHSAMCRLRLESKLAKAETYLAFLDRIAGLRFGGRDVPWVVADWIDPSLLVYPQLLYFTRGSVLEIEGDRRGAFQAYNKALSLVTANDPSVPAMRNKLEALRSDLNDETTPGT